MTYINKLKNYHPSEILREKRFMKLEAAKPKTEVEAVDDPKVNIEDEPIDEDDAIARLTQVYLTEVSEGAGSLLDKLAELYDLASRSSRVMPDNERKTAVKEFLQKRSELDQLAETKLVGGDPVFSGKLEMKGKILKLDRDKEMELKIKAFDSKSLGLDRSRIDSTAVSEKTLVEIEQAKESITITRSLVDQALNQIENKLRQKAKGSAVSSISSKTSNSSKISKVEAFHLIDLRRKQEGLAEVSGQTFGLLVNLKV